MKNLKAVLSIAAIVSVSLTILTTMLVSSETHLRGGYTSLSHGFPLAFYGATYADLLPPQYVVTPVNLVLDSLFWFLAITVCLVVVSRIVSARSGAEKAVYPNQNRPG